MAACETELCPICLDAKRDPASVCVVEQVPDLMAIERSAAYRGTYHVLHGRLSPINGVGPDQLNLASFEQRLKDEPIAEVVLALGNDIEGEATCHYISETIHAVRPSIKISRIGFGLPSGSGLTFADPATLRSAPAERRLAYPADAEAFWVGQAELAAERIGDEALERMTPAVAHLSDLFTTERPDKKFPDYFADPRLLAAYGVFFLPQSFTRTSFALAQVCGLRAWRPSSRIPTILDLGSGPGSCGVAAAYRLREAGCRSAGRSRCARS
ncbi:MAG: hypothetical protein RI910_2904 [Verrucomicrobiota bacterium]